MRIPRLFVELALAVDSTVTLPDAASHYLRNVLRCRSGDRVCLFNGKGGAFEGTVTDVGRHGTKVHLDQFDDRNRESRLLTRVALAITKRDAMDNAIQKATELGVTEITPVITAFTSVPARSLTKRHDHWLQITRSASEQCERNLPPQLNPVTPLQAWVNQVEAEIKLIAHPGANSNFLLELDASPASVALLVGPEGGLSEPEVELALAMDFDTVSLGPRILRADTAPVVLLGLLQARWGDLS